MIRAVIDIGTNTAHLFIAEVEDGQIQTYLCKQRFYTFLGDDGLQFISEQAQQRLFAALDEFTKKLQEANCPNVHVIATEGLRAASNSSAIINIITHEYRWPVSLISGDEEANLITRGVELSIDMDKGSYLIMDIGGGSVEFIWMHYKRKAYQQSYPIGISRLFEQFHKADPFTTKDISRMNQHLDKVLQEMWSVIKVEISKTSLIGCAGTFEVFLPKEELNDVNIRISSVKKEKLTAFLSQVLHQPLENRKMVKDLPVERARYIVVALLLVNYVITRMKSTEFLVSKNALKEGAIVTDKYF